MSKGIAIQEFTSKMVEELPKVLFKDRNSLLNLIKTCGQEKNIVKVRKIHMDLQDRALISRDVYLTTALIRTYTKCGAMREAREVFEQLPIQDVVSWTILMSGYSQLGLNHEALKCYKHMQDEGVCPDSVTYLCALKACGNLGSLEIGEDIDIEVRKVGFLKKDVMLGATLVDMYAKCGAFEKARNVLEYIPVRNVVCWTALIAGYVQHGLGYEALKCFHEMEGEGIYPNAITYACVLKACTMLKDLDTGKGIDADLRKKGLLHKDIVLGTALIDMYAHCGALGKARETFSELPIHDVVSWSALIAGYVQYGLWDTALKYFKQMRDEGISPNMVTFLCILKACGKTGSLEMGEEVHKEVNKQRLLKKYGVLGNALVDMYAKCGALGKAQEVFRELSIQDVISWTALISGYTQHGFDEEALKCFEKMRDEGVSPNVVTFICILKACGQIGFLKMGEEIHEQIGMKGLFEKYIVLGNTLVDMYAKFGLVEKAQETFDKLPIRDLVSWNALIAGYAQLGQPRRVFNVFGKMRESNTIPDLITFLVLLNACSHAGLVQEGGTIFATMESVYKFNPTLEHYTCMVDLFSRAGHFDKVISVIEGVPLGDQLPLWLTLLGACYKWVNVHLGRWAFKRSLQLDEKCEASYVCMGNIYAAAGMHAEAEKMEAWRVANDINFWVDRCE